jgi:hypothetical protein
MCACSTCRRILKCPLPAIHPQTAAFLTPCPPPTLPSPCRAALAPRGAPPSAGSPAPDENEWWPGGLSSPTLYFQLRRRQLHLQYKTSASST